MVQLGGTGRLSGGVCVWCSGRMVVLREAGAGGWMMLLVMLLLQGVMVVVLHSQRVRGVKHVVSYEGLLSPPCPHLLLCLRNGLKDYPE